LDICSNNFLVEYPVAKNASISVAISGACGGE